MKLTNCAFCNKIKYTPYKVVDIEKGKAVDSMSLCKECGEIYTDIVMGKKEPPKEPEIIDTQQQLIDFLMGLSMPSKPQPLSLCSNCGWTEKDFDKHGRMGCPTCYDHFQGKMEKLVYPYHGARQHVGKMPASQMARKHSENPVEKMKLLKLMYA